MNETADKPISADKPEDTIVLARERHLKWQTLDVVELALMWMSGILLAVFTFATLLDVTTRYLGVPVPWLQEAILGAFVWGTFLGSSVAVRRNQHFVVSTLAKGMEGRKRLALELFTHLAMLAVCLSVAGFGFIFFLQSTEVLSQPSGVSLATITAALPVSGVFMTLFIVERLVNGMRNGFESAEDSNLLELHAEDGRVGE